MKEEYTEVPRSPGYVCWMGRMEYEAARELQENVAAARAGDYIPDTLLLVEHPPTYTLGRRAKAAHLLVSAQQLAAQGIQAFRVDRGGDVTYHGPGQLVGYPVLNLREHQRSIGRYLRDLEEAIIRTIELVGVSAARLPGYTGVWVGDEKIAAIGVRVDARGITRHGFAVNVATDLHYFSHIVPCGIRDKGVTSIARVQGVSAVEVADVIKPASAAFGERFNLDLVPISLTELKGTVKRYASAGIQGQEYAESNKSGTAGSRKPAWLRVPLPGGETYERVKAIVRSNSLTTVCQEARCPNIAECWSNGTATFMILGSQCTRRCAFCTIHSGSPQTKPDWRDGAAVAGAAAAMKLRHVVITSVTRDDLSDGGASAFADTIHLVRRQGCTVEVLVPDFSGDRTALQRVIEAGPDILGHNVETVPRLYPRVRPQAEYRRSLQLLHRAKRYDPEIMTKSGIMVGLGETWSELDQVISDLRSVTCDILTIGQYLRPGPAQCPVVRYYTPDEFAALEAAARAAGFAHVHAGPLVRSSYHAAAWSEMGFSANAPLEQTRKGKSA